MTDGSSTSTNRLPEVGAGFVWEQQDGALVLRPRCAAANAGFTTRMGGVSPEPWATLNLEFGLGDSEENVMRNRGIAGRATGAGSWWCTVRQVHGSSVVRAEPFRAGDPEADALWTDEPSRTLVVKAADCIPVLLAGRRGIAVAHAGWRGAVAGVVEAAARAVEASELYAGPGIGPCCFEVGREVTDVFRERFGASVLVEPSRVDLWAAVVAAGRDAGVVQARTARVCTSCHPDLFFSHRRDQGRTGRQGLVACLK